MCLIVPNVCPLVTYVCLIVPDVCLLVPYVCLIVPKVYPLVPYVCLIVPLKQNGVPSKHCLLLSKPFLMKVSSGTKKNIYCSSAISR